MSSIPENIKNIRTLEDVAYLLNILFTNLNNQNEIYYNLFINPVPMDITLERYDETGKLVTVTLPNRAKDIIQTYSGSGNPNGIQVAKIGALYIDTDAAALYYKGSGSDSYGWILLWSSLNLVAGADYLAPDGNGSQLTALNAANIASGILPVVRGGSGANLLTGLIKGNGTEPFTAAVDSIDYLGPDSFTGLVTYYPVATIPTGWLKCDGGAYSRTTYANLFSVIGTTYGTGDGTNTFNVPDLRNYFVRCWDGSSNFNTVQNAQVGGHTHTFSGTTSGGTAHSHTRGSMNITGQFGFESNVSGTTGTATVSGSFYTSSSQRAHLSGNVSSGNTDIIFDASRNWSGSTSAESSHTHTYSGTTGNNNTDAENRVINKMLVPIIKY